MRIGIVVVVLAALVAWYLTAVTFASRAPEPAPVREAPSSADRQDAVPHATATDALRQAAPGVDGLEQLPDSRTAFVDEGALFAAHLGPAPRDLQLAARELFLTQAKHFEEQLAKQGYSQDLRGLMSELDDAFALRLRTDSADELAAGRGLLWVDGLDYSEAVRDHRYLWWGGHGQLFGRQVGVVVILPPDDELDSIETAFCEARLAWLSERLVAFNGMPYEERKSQIDAYLAWQEEAKAGGQPQRDWFGVPGEYLRLLKFDRAAMTLLPIE